MFTDKPRTGKTEVTCSELPTQVMELGSKSTLAGFQGSCFSPHNPEGSAGSWTECSGHPGLSALSKEPSKEKGKSIQHAILKWPEERVLFWRQSLSSKTVRCSAPSYERLLARVLDPIHVALLCWQLCHGDLPSRLPDSGCPSHLPHPPPAPGDWQRSEPQKKGVEWNPCLSGKILFSVVLLTQMTQNEYPSTYQKWVEGGGGEEQSLSWVYESFPLKSATA